MGQLFRRIHYLLYRRKLEQELQNDIAVHREMLGQEYQKDFGNALLLQERSYEAWGWGWLDRLSQDLRYGFRMLRKNPGFTLVALLALGLGIGANTALFSVVYGVLLKPLPYADGQQLVELKQTLAKTSGENMGFSVKEIQDYRQQNRSMSKLAEYHLMSFILLDDREPARVRTTVVSSQFFDTLGIKPYLGRFFTESDETKDSDAVLVLSFPYWKKRYAGDPGIVGSKFRMNDRVHTVIGVMPPVPQYPSDSDVYMTTVACPYRGDPQHQEDREMRMMGLVGRLQPGETLQSGATDMALVASRLQKAYPASYPADRGFTAGMDGLQSHLTENVKPMLLILLGTAGLVLLIACANVANLALARMMRREQELAVRSAMGASRGRLVRQLLTESTMLSLAGGALGLWLASFSLTLLVTFVQRFTTRASEVSISLPVLLFTLAISVMTGLIFGSIPAFSQRLDLVNSLKESNASTEKSNRHRMRSLLVVGQVAISFILLTGAGLMIRSFIKLQLVDAGYNGDHVLTANVPLNFSKYKGNVNAVRSFFDQVLEKLKHLPGVQGAAANSGAPLAPGMPFRFPLAIEGRPVAAGQPKPEAHGEVATADAFRVLGVPLLSGRFFNAHDTETSPPVVIISQGLARHYFPNENPIDKRISGDGQHWARIVGVVGDVKQFGLDQDPIDTVYEAFEQSPGAFSLMIKTAGDPMGYIKQVREVVYSVDPTQPTTDFKTLDELRGDTLAGTRLTSLLLGLFAALALAIAATGLSGVTALLVSQRTREIGIRLALGAQRSQVLRMVLLQGMRVILIGLVVGLAGSLAGTRVLKALLFDTAVTDPVTFAGVAMVLLAVALLASYIPARRVIRVDPMIALRAE